MLWLILMLGIAAADIHYELPEKLSATLINNKELIAFKPEHALWTDGAAKERWIYIPKEKQIDTKDMNHWNFPVGTWAFKQFSLNGKKLETRVFVKTTSRNGISSWQMAAYIWNEEQTEAKISYAGENNVLGTRHDVPSPRQCVGCHLGASDANLGFSAFQQASLLGELVKRNLLSDPPKNEIKIIGTPLQRKALGYLHANCSHCHNPNGVIGIFDVYYNFNAKSVADTNAYKTLVKKPSRGSDFLRVEPGSPEKSYLFQRLVSRTPGIMMPPLGTEVVDTVGAETISQWITSLAHE